jgi:hypothetical protein
MQGGALRCSAGQATLVGDLRGTRANALKLLLPLAARFSMRKLGSDRPDRWITSA